VADAFPGSLDGSLGGLSEQGLELGEDLLDRIEVGAVGRQEEQFCTDRADGTAHSFAFVAAEIVNDDDVARLQRWHQHLLDISQEALAIDWTVDDAGRVDPIAT
jgi:hypothetical protein